MLRNDPLTQKAYQFALQTIRFLDTIDKSDFVVQTITRQLIRSATSVVANVVEAQGASSKKDFSRFFRYSFKSAHESECWIRLLVDSGRASASSVAHLLTLVDEVFRLLQASLLTLGKEA